MKRTTVFADDAVMKKLKEIADRENCTVSKVARTALTEFVSRRQRKKSRLSLIGVGKSGRKDVAERAEELLGKQFGR